MEVPKAAEGKQSILIFEEWRAAPLADVHEPIT
jgi:hypothetical protein